MTVDLSKMDQKWLVLQRERVDLSKMGQRHQKAVQKHAGCSTLAANSDIRCVFRGSRCGVRTRQGACIRSTRQRMRPRPRLELSVF